jgi:shikimate kinase
VGFSRETTGGLVRSFPNGYTGITGQPGTIRRLFANVNRDAQAQMGTRETTDPTAPPTGRPRLQSVHHVVLLGLMGSGKTEVGRRLARLLAVRFEDNDGRLAAASGLTARELRLRDGEAVLHALEAQELLAALREPQPSVMGAAASVVENADCRAAMLEPTVCAIGLRGRAETMALRFHNEAHRPVYSDDLTAFFERQLAVRTPLYLEASSGVVDIDDLGVTEVAARCLEIVEAHDARPAPRPA